MTVNVARKRDLKFYCDTDLVEGFYYKVLIKENHFFRSFKKKLFKKFRKILLSTENVRKNLIFADFLVIFSKMPNFCRKFLKISTKIENFQKFFLLFQLFIKFFSK